MINQNIKKFFKALDKFLKTSITLVLVIILLAVVISKVVVYMDFLENKKLVIEYLEREYDFEFELIDSSKGQVSWPAPREDSFIFYDTDNKLYFYVTSYGKDIYDLYEYATDEEMNYDNLNQLIDDKINEKSHGSVKKPMKTDYPRRGVDYEKKVK